MFAVKEVPVESCDPVLRNPKTKPILFNTEMARAILDGRKTQTRRVVKGIEGLNVYRAEPAEDAYETLHQWDFFYGWSENGALFDAIQSVKAPYAPGDILWVRETWCKGRVEYGEEPDGRNVPYIGQCTGDDNYIPKEWALRNDVGTEDVVWRPSIHMPKEAARIFLKVNYVRVERLQGITEEQAVKEGCAAGRIEITCGPWGVEDDPDEWTAVEDFRRVWYDTIKIADFDKYGWDANPWVWVIEFERCEKPEGWCVTD